MIELQVCDSGGSQLRSRVTFGSIAAAYATAGLSVRMSELHEQDRAECDTKSATS